MKKGLLHIYTGLGKGKTTAALGLAIRAAGQGFAVLFVQFFKEDTAPSGEKAFLDGVKDSRIEIMRSNCRHPIFTKGTTDEGAVAEAIISTFDAVKEKVSGGNIHLLILDEVMAAVNGGWIDEKALIDFLDKRPESLEVVLTGRDAPAGLVQMADYVTEMLKIKHPFDAGVPARRGIEF